MRSVDELNAANGYRMHIAFVTTGDIRSIATSKRAFGLAAPFTRMGIRVSIIAEDTVSNRERIEAEAPTAQAVWFPRASAIRELLQKRDIISQIRPTHVYCCSPGVRNQLSILFCGSRIKFIVEHSELLSAVHGRTPLKRMLDFFNERLAIGTFNGQIAASRFLERYLRNILSSRGEQIFYSPYGFSPTMNVWDEQRLREIKYLVAGRPCIVYMGTLSRNYGIFDILAAANELRSLKKNFVILVIGDGRDADAARLEVKRLELQEEVHFAGYVSDRELPSFLKAANSFVSPLFDSVQDRARCPSKLFLYLAFGRPIVTTKIGEALELLGDHYDFFFVPGDVPDLARALDAALSAPVDWEPPWCVDEHTWEARALSMLPWLARQA